MSEIVPGYTADRFPYSDVLAELTDKVLETGMTPVQAYATFQRWCDQDLRIPDPYYSYMSTSITTGGHAHLTDNIGEIIAANTKTAREIVTVLDEQGSLPGRRALVPVDLGKTGWSQSEYMTFWSLGIAGPDFLGRRGGHANVAGFEKYLDKALTRNGIDYTLMNDGSVPREERRPQYERFKTTFANAIKNADIGCFPAIQVIPLVDQRISLGSNTEVELAKELDIPLQWIAPVQPSSLESAIPSNHSGLREDLTIMRAAGASVCVAAKGSFLTLVGEDPHTNVSTGKTSSLV